MEADPTHSEEMPSLLWGLDPVFSAFARLYIKDIHGMKESKQVSGIFFYNGHPIRQVDVVGTVVLTKERDAFYSYGVDDSTGVINCICWKNLLETEKPLPASTAPPGTSSSLNLVEQIRKLQELVRWKSRLEIGDVARVRGHLRIYRGQREIQGSAYYKVDDPVCDVQISRMLELPRLYREVYDQPFQIPQKVQSDLSNTISKLSEKMKDFLVENKIQTFYQQDLETVESLVSLASRHVPSAGPEQMTSRSDPRSKSIHSAFKEAIKMLLEKGVVFQKLSNPEDVYHVTEQDKDLHRAILGVIRESCQKPKYAEKGCHFRFVLACVQQTYSPCVTEAVVLRVLDLMESNSDIVSSMEGYYTAF